MIPISVYHYSYLPISETFIYNQLKTLREHFDLTLFSLTLENLKLYPGVHPAVIPQKSLGERLSGKYRTTTFTPSRIRFIEGLIRNTRLLHVNFGHMGLSVQHFARNVGVPMTVMFHGVDGSALLRDPDYAAEYRRSTFHTVFTVSKDMAERVRPFLPGQTRVIPMHLGIPVEQFTFRQRSRLSAEPIFLQVSRLDHKKGIGTTLEVFHRFVHEVNSRARLIIAGDGPLRESLERQAGLLGLQSQVKFLGTVTQGKVAELMHGADVFLQHSVTAPDGDMEGIPVILMEAMASGLPVVSTFHSGIPELVHDRMNGFLVNEFDQEEYFETLRQISDSDISAISEQARETVITCFDSRINYRKLVSALDEVAMSREPS